MKASFRAFARGATENLLIELDGVTALVVPPPADAPHPSSSPTSLVVNSVVYDGVEALEAALDRLAEAYAAARVPSWTVWVHPDDRRAARMLEARGHELVASGIAMGRELDRLPDAGIERFDWTRDGDLATFTELADGVYGWREMRPWSHALRHFPDASTRIYLASVEGRAVSGLLTHEHEGDCAIWLMATAPAARGHGLASALLVQALVDARDRGCTTTTLQATALGAPLDARLGYRELGTIEGWKRSPDD